MRHALLVGSALLIGGCTPWIVVRQAAPNPLAGQTQFAVHPLNFDGLVVGGKTHGEYLAGKDPGQRASWQADLLAMNQLFAEQLYANTPGYRIAPVNQGQPPVAGFNIVPRIVFIEPGFYAGIVAASAQVRMVMQIYSGGTLLDEIHTEVSVPADFVNASSGQRLRNGAVQLGNIAAHYLRARTGR